MGFGFVFVVEKVVEVAVRGVGGSSEIEDAARVGGSRRCRLRVATADGFLDFGGGGGDGATAHSAEAVVVGIFIAAVRAAHRCLVVQRLKPRLLFCSYGASRSAPWYEFSDDITNAQLLKVSFLFQGSDISGYIRNLTLSLRLG